MNIFLDIRTLSVVMGATFLTLGFSMVYYSGTRKTYPGFGAWTVATVLVSLAFFLISLRHVIPSFFSIIMPNSLFCLGLALFYIGFKDIAEKKGKTYLHLGIVLVLSFTFVSFFTYVTPNVNARICVISFAAALYLFFSTLVLVRGIQYGLLKLNRLLTGTLILMAGLFVFRGIFFLLPGNTVNRE